MHKHIIAIVALFFGYAAAQAQEISYTEAVNLCKSTTRSSVSVHDPSVVFDLSSKKYYIFGTMRGVASSADMQNWTTVALGRETNLAGAEWPLGVPWKAGGENNVFSKNAFSVPAVKKVPKGGAEVDMPAFDAYAWSNASIANWDISGNLWAPDIIYNPTMKKWCMYFSVNGEAWLSSIVLLTSNSITGPYEYQGPVVITGFRNTSIDYHKTDLEVALGAQPSLPSRYNRPSNNNGSLWGDRWPHAIDPCVFFDEAGEMWMSYGSWSGGIWMLKLNKENGLRDYDVVYESIDGDQNTVSSDPYFGKKIAGGVYVSGEGSYIQHIGQYYYLFMSYGRYAPNGGYEMRVFRSENPDGPYTDINGQSAIFTRWVTNFGDGIDNRGEKLMGAYNNWGLMTVGECAQGHNSAIVDNQGRAFIVYHTKFNDGHIDRAYHSVRTHQLFTNQQGWLVAAPFQFDGETETDESIATRCLFTKEEIAGTYNVLIHKYKMDYANMEEVTPIELTLTDNGRVTGDLTGTWTQTEGTGYIRITVGNVTYNGVIVEQTIDGTNAKAVAFTAVANSGAPIWGYRVADKYAVGYTAKDYTVPVRENATVGKHLALYGDGLYGAKIEWESSVPEVISNTGKYNPTDEATRVTLTMRISAGTWYCQQEFHVTAQKRSEMAGDFKTGMVAYYDFDDKPTANAFNSEQRATYSKKASGTATTLEYDPARIGQVAHQYAGSYANASYTRFPNPLQGRSDLEGFTVSMLVKRADANLTDLLWGFTDKMGSLATVAQRMFLTGNAFLAFDNGTDNFSINAPDAIDTKFIPVNEWVLLTVTVSATDGINIYVNGTRKAHKTFTSTAGTAATVAKAAELFDYQKVVAFIAEAGYFQLGLGSATAGSAEAWFDDLIIYDRALPLADVRALNTAENCVTDFTDAILAPVWTENSASAKGNAVFNLRGQRINGTPTQRGIYIYNGKKVVVK